MKIRDWFEMSNSDSFTAIYPNLAQNSCKLGLFLFLPFLLPWEGDWNFPSLYKKHLQSSSTPLCHVFMWKNLTRILLCFFFIINTDHSLLCSDRNNHRGSVVHARKWIAWMTSSCTLVAMTRSMSPGGWLYMLNLSLWITDTLSAGFIR